jgi:hypothetical protein
MNNPFEQFRTQLRALKLDNSLLFLNHLLAVSRGESRDPALERDLQSLGYPVPVFVVHFVAKWLLREASDLGLYTLEWKGFRRLMDLAVAIDDPIVGDPAWKNANPTGFFERLFAQQLPPQRFTPLRDYGLALALFRDAGTPAHPGDYNLRSALEAELGMPIERFMATAHVCQAIRGVRFGRHQMPSTLTHMHLVEAFHAGLAWMGPEIWEPFLARLSCTRDAFRQLCLHPEYMVNDRRYVCFEFNPLLRYPLIEIRPGHYWAVDPRLLVSRATWGLFYDLFERERTGFSTRFGDVLARLVGDMLASVCPAQSLWSDADWVRGPGATRTNRTPKRGDWAFKGKTRTALIECKSLRPSLPLVQYGAAGDVESLASRVAKGLEQVMEQSRAMQEGRWAADGLPPAPTVCVLLTYGTFNTVNLPFFRREVREKLAEAGHVVQPFVTLSLEEFDTVIRLVEQGEALDEVLVELAEEEDSAEVLQRFAPKLTQGIISSFAQQRGQAFLESISLDMRNQARTASA